MVSSTEAGELEMGGGVGVGVVLQEILFKVVWPNHVLNHPPCKKSQGILK